MKINEKNLINFACSKSYIDREGWLGKRGEVNKSFQKRWFVLKGNLLFYFEKRDDKEPVGLIILEGCTVELAENEEIYAFKLVFHGAGNRTYILCAKSQENMEQWMKALASASYDYVKLMVGELQRQLDEVTEMEKQAVSSVPNHVKSGPSMATASSEDDLLHHSAGSRMKGSRQRYLFLELHEYYGQIFRPIFKEQKAKRAASNKGQEHPQQDLITFS
ncbi:sesquipedalian-1 [Caerostris darwini]|uniref:Sesquipedalian-1 n=1 Tax=Caerostris darwini TaxID=1538125 RepID=A0AAV4MQG9_9ARAC|nr:sesquipedalian-1 [Caerostris darwini]